MFERFRTRSRNRRIVDTLYGSIVEESRKAELFTDCGLPDTVMGRFESLGIHVFLFLERCRGDAALGALAQDLVDRFISDIEDSIREIGIGDVTVPKRMRKLAGMFYERIAAYDPALQAGDVERLADALQKHALDHGAVRHQAIGLARYMIATRARYDDITESAILRGDWARGTDADAA